LIACENNNINCVLGIEFGFSWKNENLHLLAYNFDKDNEAMKSLISQNYDGGECEWIIYNMSLDYPQISLEDYRKFEYPKEKGGWKYIYYAAARGIVKTYEEGNGVIYGKYSTPNHLFNYGQNLQDFFAIIKEASGVPVLAHPGDLYKENTDEFTNILKELKTLGIEGIECYYPSHPKDFTNICVDFCKNNDLRITGGCDCHGDFDKSEGFTIGALDISLEMLDLKGII
jgi:predicted metal-dependent phosphoesterase TrpH